MDMKVDCQLLHGTVPTFVLTEWGKQNKNNQDLVSLLPTHKQRVLLLQQPLRDEDVK